MSSILITERNEGFKESLVDFLYAARQHNVKNKERANWFFHSLRQLTVLQ